MMYFLQCTKHVILGFRNKFQCRRQLSEQISESQAASEQISRSQAAFGTIFRVTGGFLHASKSSLKKNLELGFFHKSKQKRYIEFFPQKAARKF
jgi:hypothetical protein